MDFFGSSANTEIHRSVVAESDLDEIQKFLNVAQNASDEEEKKGLYRMIINMLVKKITFFSDLKTKILKGYYGYYGESTTPHDFSDMYLTNFHLTESTTFNDILEYADSMFNKHLSQLKLISLEYINRSCQQEFRERGLNGRVPNHIAALPLINRGPNPLLRSGGSPPRI